MVPGMVGQRWGSEAAMGRKPIKLAFKSKLPLWATGYQSHRGPSGRLWSSVQKWAPPKAKKLGSVPTSRPATLLEDCSWALSSGSPGLPYTRTEHSPNGQKDLWCRRFGEGLSAGDLWGSWRIQVSADGPPAGLFTRSSHTEISTCHLVSEQHCHHWGNLPFSPPRESQVGQDMVLSVSFYKHPYVLWNN